MPDTWPRTSGPVSTGPPTSSCRGSPPWPEKTRREVAVRSAAARQRGAVHVGPLVPPAAGPAVRAAARRCPGEDQAAERARGAAAAALAQLARGTGADGERRVALLAPRPVRAGRGGGRRGPAAARGRFRVPPG